MSCSVSKEALLPAAARPVCLMPVGIRSLEVARLADVTPVMRRITLTGAELKEFTDSNGNFTAEFLSPNFDDDVRLLFPYPGEDTPVLPVIENGRVTFAPGRRPIARAYTVRRFDSGAGELDLDIILHGDGYASTWAKTVAIGDPIPVVGPGKTLPLPKDVNRSVLLGDDTAIPAIARFLEELAPNSEGEAFITVPNGDYIYPLTSPDLFEVHWLVAEPSKEKTERTLCAALQDRDLPAENLFVWVAGEQSEVQATRRYLVNERGIPRQAVSFTGYWRRGHCGLPAPEQADRSDSIH